MLPSGQDGLQPSPYLKANILSKMFYWWLNGFFGEGSKRALELSDLHQALPQDRSKKLGDRMQELWNQEIKKCDAYNTKGKKKSMKPSLRKVIIKQFGGYFMLLGLMAFIEECFTRIAQPIALGYLIRCYEPSKIYTKTHEKWLFAGAVVFGAAFYTSTHHPYFFGVQYIGMKIRIACCSLVYRKSLRLSQAAIGQTTVGQLVNLLSNDVTRFDDSTMFLHYLWIGPIQTVIVTVVLWYHLHYKWASFVGLGIIAVFIPFQAFLGKQFSKLRTSTADKTDIRIRIMNEVIGGMRAIKMYSWEKPFSLLVGKSRETEINVLKKTNTLRAVNETMFFTSSKIIIFLTLITFVLTGNNLTAQQVFVTLALYNNVHLIMMLFFPNGVAQLAESLVSIERIQEFLLLEEKADVTSYTSAPLASKSSTSNASLITKTIKLENLSAGWIPEHNTLTDISLEIGNKELLVVVGHVGAGKSTLLHVIMNELPPSSGNIRVTGSIAYTCQEPWVFAGTVRQNILFGRKYSESRYQDVVEACALKRDLELLPYGDSSLVGDKGASLSGGQKARITLARAVYADADIYVLDDPLSAVDAEVGRHLFDNCICGILKDKTRVLVTHQLQLLESVKQILVLQDGRIAARGDYATVVSPDAENSVLKSKKDQPRKRPTMLGSHSKWRRLKGNLRATVFRLKGMSSSTVYPEQQKSIKSINVLLSEAVRKWQTFPRQKYQTVDPRTNDEETIAAGSVGFRLYAKYIGAGSNCFTLFILILANILTQTLYTGTDWWLSFWTEVEEKNAEHKNQKRSKSLLDDRYFHIYVYSGFVLALFIASFFRTMIFFKICMKASVNLHQSMFLGVIRSPMKFFEINPIGRILNRVAKDIGLIDEALPSSMFDTMEIFLSIIGILAIVGLVNPLLLAPTLVLSFIFIFLRRFYLKTARSVKRLEGTTRSPVFSHLSTSLYGLTTIRAFKVESSFIKQFDDYQDMHTSSWYIFIAVTRWLGVWLDWISVVFIAFVSFSFMFDPFQSLYDSDPKYKFYIGEDVGLAISSAMALTGMFQWGVNQSVELENQMVSVERVIEYSKLEPEADAETPKGQTPPPSDWPSRGEIKFNHLELRFSKDDKPVLKDVTCVINPSDKIGIVGRTGAGKSTLITALFRLAEPTGQLIIDGIDALHIGLHELRSKISIIPQEPVLFSGSLRLNLDPFGKSDDKQLWNVLEDVQLKNDVKHVPAGLDMEVSEDGANFSVGQRQLICLARAILKNNIILVLDEATANVDPRTDALIQKTIRTKFAACTTLTIAHRLHTVMDSTKIIVLDAGSILEYDEPITLLLNKQSSLYQLAEQSGALDSLITIAKDASAKRQLLLKPKSSLLNPKASLKKI